MPPTVAGRQGSGPELAESELLELGRWAPNHHVTNPWRFRVVGSEGLKPTPTSSWTRSVALDVWTLFARPYRRVSQASLTKVTFNLAFIVSGGGCAPKWGGSQDLGDNEVARRKVELLHASFPSQKDRDWWDDEVFLGLARLRGMECRSRYAEAFDCQKASLKIAS